MKFDFYLLPSVITLTGVVIAIILFIRWLILLKRQQLLTAKELFYCVLLLALSIWVNAVSEERVDRLFYEEFRYIYGFWIDPSIIIGIISVAKIVTPIFLIAYLLYKGYFKNRTDIEVRQTQVDDFVNRVFNDEKFHTAFSVSLPKGADDKEFGLDYIPFMLQNIENKRRRFKTYADRFLTATLILGISFVFMVIAFGYILLNDTSIGIAKNITDLKSEMNTANANLSLIQNREFETTLLSQYSIDFNQIKRELSEKTIVDKPGIKHYLNAIQKFQTDNNFDNLFIASRVSLDSLQNSRDNSPALNTLSNVHSQLDKFNNSIEYAKANYSLATKELITLFPKIQQEIEKPQNQLNELIKRLILSIVIVSFFLAILRYTARLYLNNYNLMIQAENDDFAIRKFYVALKNTDKNQDERKIVIQSLLEIIRQDQDTNNSNLNLSKEETGMIKDLLNNLMKKL